MQVCYLRLVVAAETKQWPKFVGPGVQPEGWWTNAATTFLVNTRNFLDDSRANTRGFLDLKSRRLQEATRKYNIFFIFYSSQPPLWTNRSGPWLLDQIYKLSFFWPKALLIFFRIWLYVDQWIKWHILIDESLGRNVYRRITWLELFIEESLGRIVWWSRRVVSRQSRDYPASNWTAHCLSLVTSFQLVE